RLLLSYNDGANPLLGSGKAIRIGPGGTITGQVYHDLDGDGLRDTGEPGLAGWTLYLDANNNGIRDPGETAVSTDASGKYSFTGLPNGSYVIREVLQTGWRRISPASGSYTVTLDAAQTVIGKSFGNAIPTSISGVIYDDLDDDRTRDTGEPGLANWRGYLAPNNNGNLDTGEVSVLTDSTGHYTFANLLPGQYYIRQVVQSGWQQTEPALADGETAGVGWVLDLVSKSPVTNLNFGDHHP